MNMFWIYIICASLLVFVSRYLFLEPSLPLSLNRHFKRLLHYASPAVLTAIWAPIIFMPKEQFDIGLNNPYLISAVFACLLALRTRNVLFTTLVSLLFFMLLKWFILQ